MTWTVIRFTPVFILTTEYYYAYWCLKLFPLIPFGADNTFH